MSEVFWNCIKLVSSFQKMFSAYTEEGNIKETKIPAEICITLISSEWDIVIAFVSFTYKPSFGFMICLETYNLK